MHKLSGGCHCNNILIDVELTAPPDTYRPRACNCDYCRKHGAAWLSDPCGSLLIQIKDSHDRGAYRQGSGQAELLLCKKCGVLICALHCADQRLHAAVNVRAVQGAVKFGIKQTVSPKQLSADEKANRWQRLWFADVKIHEA